MQCQSVSLDFNTKLNVATNFSKNQKNKTSKNSSGEIRVFQYGRTDEHVGNNGRNLLYECV